MSATVRGIPLVHLMGRSDRPSVCCGISDWWLHANGHKTTIHADRVTCPKYRAEESA